MNLLAFALGACSLWLLPRLLPTPALLATTAAGVTLALCLRGRRRYPVLCVLSGFVWAHMHAGWALDSRLPPGLEGEDLLAVGTIDDLPSRSDDGWQFRFCPERVEFAGEAVALHGCWRLGWYAPRRHGESGIESVSSDRAQALPLLEPGARWRLNVRLKRPRGLMNPGGFDSERKALETGIAAVGYVRENPRNQVLSRVDDVHAMRGRIAAWIDHVLTDDSRLAALLRGLAVGDRRGFTQADWLSLRHTGTTHLFAISGLHVGMIAIFAGGLIAAITWLFPAMLRLAPRRVWMLVPAVPAAFGYAWLAGFEVPTQRSLAMIVIAAAAIASRRGMGFAHSWCLALAVVLIIDPLAMLSIGFWLSYLGVAWLLLASAGRVGVPWWRSAARAQGAVALGLLPVGIGFFAQTSWVSPLVNLVAIPWLTFAVVPLLLLSLPLMVAAPVAGEIALRMSAAILDPLMRALDVIARWPGAAAAWPEPQGWSIACAMLAAALCFLPLPRRLRMLALPLALPLAIPVRPPLEAGQAELHVLDVGQGTSVLVRTRRHALLFDTGARFPNGYDLGEAVVVPALRSLGVAALDTLIVSHADTDHAGGAATVVRELPVRAVLVGEPLPDVPGEPCREGQRWTWDGVEFELLHPPKRYPARGNDVSCVLRVTASGRAALLTGDAGEVAEMRLLNLHAPRLASEVLLLGHHGSRTSSTAEFVMAVAPKLAIATAGYRNRFGHPHRQVLRRLAHHRIPVRESSRDGALRILLDGDGVAWYARRRESRRFWHEP